MVWSKKQLNNEQTTICDSRIKTIFNVYFNKAIKSVGIYMCRLQGWGCGHIDHTNLQPSFEPLKVVVPIIQNRCRFVSWFEGASYHLEHTFRLIFKPETHNCEFLFTQVSSWFEASLKVVLRWCNRITLLIVHYENSLW